MHSLKVPDHMYEASDKYCKNLFYQPNLSHSKMGQYTSMP